MNKVQMHEVFRWQHTGRFCSSDEVIERIVYWMKSTIEKPNQKTKKGAINV